MTRQADLHSHASLIPHHALGRFGSLTSPLLGMSFRNLPEETVDLICQNSREKFLADRDDTLDDGFWRTYVSIDRRLPVPSRLLALRQCSKLLRRIATPYAWESMDISCNAWPQERARSVDKGSRNTAHACYFLSLHPELAKFIQVLWLDLRAPEGSDKETALEIQSAVEAFLRVCTSLKVFHIAGSCFLSMDAARILSSCASLRAIIESDSDEHSSPWPVYAREYDFYHLEAYATQHVETLTNVLKLRCNLRRLMIYPLPSFYSLSEDYISPSDQPPLDPSSLKGVEELAIYASDPAMLSYISRAFDVSPSGFCRA